MKSGAVIDFEINKETLKVWSESASFITEAERQLSGAPRMTPMFERLIDGPGEDPQWTWHPDPARMHFAEKTIELCDGLPSHVENDKANWLTSVKCFCPWAAHVVAVRRETR